MINNICENKSVATASATNQNIRYNDIDESNDVTATNNSNSSSNNGQSRGVGLVQTTYGHGIWYSEIIDSANNTNNTSNTIFHKQQYSNNASSSNSINNNKENIVNRNAKLSTSSDNIKQLQQQLQQSTLNNNTNNECDIVIVDIEDEDTNDEVERGYQHYQLQHQHPHHQQQMQSSYINQPKFFMNANMKYSKKPTPTIYDNERCVANRNFNTCNVNDNARNASTNNDHVNTQPVTAKSIAIEGLQENNMEENEDDDDDDDSLASMETLSDNVSIWIDGEKHWVAGVDENTTCSDLIWALLNYQSGHETMLQASQCHPGFAVNTTLATKNEENIANKINSNQVVNYEQLKQHQQIPSNQQQQQPSKVYDKNDIDLSLATNMHKGSSNRPNNQNTANTNNTSTSTATTNNNNTPIPTNINQSMPINTKENCKITPNPTTLATTVISSSLSSSTAATTLISSSAPATCAAPIIQQPPPPLPPTLLAVTLPPGITTVSQLATEYVIVKQYHHCEEYLDGSTKVFDVLPPRDGSHKKQCELLLRHLGPAPAVYINNTTTPQLSSLISTDKDSGMGSPVGSARSAKFRRRKHKSSQWLAQANTLHPKLSRCTANERLMKIILAQDETIQRQLSLLREKERQITKIEEEKHRKRERELGKNYLLETYLNGLDEAECEPEIQDGEEIFIDEPYQRTTSLAPNPRTTITPTGLPLAAIEAGADKIPSTAAEAFNIMTKHKLKDKETKKEKKKKRYKEKSTADCEGVGAKDFNLKTNKNKDKEKVDKQKQQPKLESKAIEGNNLKDNNSNEQELEMQIMWLEKVYSLNKQLQKEEELAAKLHAKVRKHQLRKAQQTQQEVQLEIDKLDNNLALQCGDIRKVEANLMQTNDLLQKKLLILERLSMEYLKEQNENELLNKEEFIKNNEEMHKVCENPLKNETNNLLTNLEKSLDAQKLSLNNIKSKEEVIKLEKIIAKPNIVELKETVNAVSSEAAELSTTEANNPLRVDMKTTMFSQINPQNNQRFSNEVIENSLNDISNLAKRNVLVATTDQQHHQEHNHHQQLNTHPAINPTSLFVEQHDVAAAEAAASLSNDTMSTSCMFIDKNMLSSLQVQNAKTIKKQMFHTQTATTIMTGTATSPKTAEKAQVIGKLTAISSSSSSSQQLLQQNPSAPTLPPHLSTAIPKQQFQQHILQQHQHMPMASTFLTSRPQNSHQILPATNIVIVQQPSSEPSPLSFASSSSNLNTSTPSSSVTTSALYSSLASIKVPATVTILKTSYPPTSTSPSPSIMAMNTVDISQLGTLV